MTRDDGLFVAAATGTNGKTSVVEFSRQILDACGWKAASLGSLGFVSRLTGREREPRIGAGPGAMPHFFDRVSGIGVDALVYEAFSPGLAEGMHDHTRLDAAGFTSFAPEHLSHHGSAEAYLAAKLRLFSRALADEGTAIVNGEADASTAVVQVCEDRQIDVVITGRSREADLAVLEASREGGGTALTLSLAGERRRAFLPLFARFEIDNAMIALGIAVFGAACPVAEATGALAELTPPPGRMVRIGERNGGIVVVDYAHNALGLDAALSALRSETPGRLIVMFGAGGDRHGPEGRAAMGRAASDHADIVVVTDDNPRTEDPAQIRTEIIAGCDDVSDVREIADRAEAIRSAIDLLQPGDTVLIAGKGEEEGIERDGTVEPHSDLEVARRYLA